MMSPECWCGIDADPAQWKSFMRRPAACAVLAVLLSAGPAVAAPKCNEYGPGLHVEFGFRIGSPYTREEQEIFDKMHLRQQGINARTVTRTDDGCLEAWVPDGEGGFDTQYYDPKSFQLKLD
jgi:hypothetical protein